MCVCVVCVCTCVSVSLHVCMHNCVLKCMQVSSFELKKDFVCVFVWSVCVHVWVRVCSHTCIHNNVHKCMRLYAHAYVCIYISNSPLLILM